MLAIKFCQRGHKSAPHAGTHLHNDTVAFTLQANRLARVQQEKGDSMFQPYLFAELPRAFSFSAEEQRQARCVARSALHAGESAQEKGGTVCRDAVPATEKNRAMEDKEVGEVQSSRGRPDKEDKVSRMLKSTSGKSQDPACKAEGLNATFNFSASFAGINSHPVQRHRQSQSLLFPFQIIWKLTELSGPQSGHLKYTYAT